MSDPWKRKRRCENCRHWGSPNDPIYKGECLIARDSASAAVVSRGVLWTNRLFYCCQYSKKEG